MKKVFYFMVIGAGALLGGCATNCTQVTLPAGSTQMTTPSPIGGSDLYVNSTRQHKVGDLSRGVVALHNYSRTDNYMTYQFTWFTKDGEQVGSQSPQEPITIPSHESKQVTSVAPNPTAASFTVRACVK